MFKKKIFLPLLVVLALALTACTTDDGDVVEPEPDTTAPIEEQEETTGDEEVPEVKEDMDASADEYADIKVKPEEAFDTYMEKYPTTKVKKVQIDKEMGKYVYNVEGFEGNKEYELKIDPIDGTITKEHMETDDDMDDMEITRVNVEKVMAIVDKAIAEAGEGAKLEEWTIDMDDGKTKLDVEIDKKGFDNVEHTYDVETGELVEIDD